MDSALAGYRSSDEETGPLGEIITGESILLPPELVFSGDALGCLTCYASSDEDQTDRDAPAASAAQAPAPPGVTAWSDPTDEQAVRQLISAEISQTQAAGSLERALMGLLQAERRAARSFHAHQGHPCSEAHAPRWSEGHATHSRPGLAYLSKRFSAWLLQRQRPLGPCSCPSTCCGSCRHACPWPWKTFDRLFPVPGQGTPCSHDATNHLECAFPAAPAYARASASSRRLLAPLKTDKPTLLAGADLPPAVGSKSA